MTATQTTRTVAQKMGVVAGSRARLVDAPANAVHSMQLPDIEWLDERAEQLDYAHLFVTDSNQMRIKFTRLRDQLKTDGDLWVSWPKAGRFGTDLNLVSVIAIGYELNMVESTCLRINDVWAGLKFTHPKPGKSYRNSYGQLSD